ncbi:MAG: hypothetical protein WC054_07565 [Candidatus Nanopelagicales bacterium]
MSRPSADNAPETESNPPTDSLNDARWGLEVDRFRDRERPLDRLSERRGAPCSSPPDSTTEIRSGGTDVPCRFGTEESG